LRFSRLLYCISITCTAYTGWPKK